MSPISLAQPQDTVDLRSLHHETKLSQEHEQPTVFHADSPLSESLSDMDTDPSDYEHSADEFERLISDIKVIMGPCSGLDSSEIDTERLMASIRSYVSEDAHWSKYAFADNAYDYTRNGVDDINHKANMLILVWSPHKGSKIHDHANAHCIVKMLSGTLRETLYDMPDTEKPEHLTVKRVSDYTRDQVSYMSDNIGLHRMENPCDVPAVSLHLYTPPYASKFGCHVYDEATGTSTKVSMSNLYSDRGIKNEVKACSC